MGFRDNLKHAWNAFMNRDPTEFIRDVGPGDYQRPDRIRTLGGQERSLIATVYNRIALDVSAIEITHVRVDSDNRYLETIKSGLNNCLTLSANIDQTGRAFIQDAVITMLDEGCVALVPVETTINPKVSGSYDINSIRAGKIVQWYPQHVKVSLYNELTGKREEIIVPKSSTAIIENPFYSIMNEPNSTARRLKHKLALLDVIDDASADNKFNLIIQVPYMTKTKLQESRSRKRVENLEKQIGESKYGIGYIDGTEKVIQLNRSLDNTLPGQIDYFTKLFYSQLGITQEILDGTADDRTMQAYSTRIVEPILSAFTDEIRRKFFTKTALTQGQSVMFFKDPFKLMPISNLSSVVDSLKRNEILSSNEIRQGIGYKPSTDAHADELRNSNVNTADTEAANVNAENQNENLDEGSHEQY